MHGSAFYIYLYTLFLDCSFLCSLPLFCPGRDYLRVTDWMCAMINGPVDFFSSLHHADPKYIHMCEAKGSLRRMHRDGIV
ncbi:hypothetical protein BJX63DRAFT_190829 [Aspergillus granulosus]|uniref:Secreted protein n=1 Tax=Aspergillus granulosus TaxID=176169 RepID=A0ABR4HH62_9EURO